MNQKRRIVPVMTENFQVTVRYELVTVKLNQWL